MTLFWIVVILLFILAALAVEADNDDDFRL